MAGGPPRDTLLLASQATRLSAEIERRIGFAEVLEERFPHLQMLRLPTSRPAPRRGKGVRPLAQKDITRLGSQGATTLDPAAPAAARRAAA